MHYQYWCLCDKILQYCTISSHTASSRLYDLNCALKRQEEKKKKL